MTHEIKTWPPFFDAVRDGTKTFELRRYDRPYRVGDTLTLNEWNPATEQYTGRFVTRRITYMLHDAERHGLMPGFCVLGLSSTPEPSR